MSTTRSNIVVGAALFVLGAAATSAWTSVEARHATTTAPARSAGEQAAFEGGRRLADAIILRGELYDADLLQLRTLYPGMTSDDRVRLRQSIAKAVNDGRLRPRPTPGHRLMF